jgi:hypothetical protein
MKTRSSVLLACCLCATAGAAQTPSQPNVILTIFGGVATGNSLWIVGRQPVCVLNTSDDNCSPAFDTLRLTREASSSLLFGVQGTYYTGPNLGYTAEVFYLGLPLDDTCSGVFYNPDPGADPFYGPRNEQTCGSITAAGPSTSAIAFFGGMIFRLAATRAISPYVRGSMGLVTYSTGIVEMSGDFVQSGNIRSRAIIVDDNPKKIAFSGQLAAGMTVRLGPGYLFRFELRDVLIPLARVTGPAVLANRLEAPTATKLFHQAALIMGFDVVLEKKRGRRY